MDKKTKLLVVDDELKLREIISLSLKGKYSVATASGAKEAFEYMADNPVDLVLLDIKMPEINGMQALDEIKKRHPDVIVILMTAFASLETIRQALRLGAFGFLMKPFDIEELTNIINKALRDMEPAES